MDKPLTILALETATVLVRPALALVNSNVPPDSISREPVPSFINKVPLFNSNAGAFIAEAVLRVLS